MFCVFDPEELRADNRHNLLDILDDLNSRNCVKLGEGGGGQELGDQFNSPPKWLLSGTPLNDVSNISCSQ